MATFTQNYNLKKPEGVDFYDVEDFNGNAEIIDEQLKKNEDAQKVYTNLEVLTSDFTPDTTYADYPYKVEIACEGLTNAYIPSVNLPMAQATSGNFAPVALADTGKIILYAAEVEEDAFTIPSIVCAKGGA